MKQKHEFRKESTEQQHSETEQHQQTRPDHLAFNTPEEMLRYDAAQINVPEGVEQKLRESLAREEPQLEKSWWQRMFGS